MNTNIPLISVANLEQFCLPQEQVSLINGWIQERTAQVYHQLTHKDEKLSVKTRMMLLQNHLRRKFHVDQVRPLNNLFLF